MTKSIIYYTDNRLGEPIFSAVQRKLLQSDRKSTRLNSSHSQISYAVFCLKKKKNSECESTMRGDHMTAIIARVRCCDYCLAGEHDIDTDPRIHQRVSQPCLRRSRSGCSR